MLCWWALWALCVLTAVDHGIAPTHYKQQVVLMLWLIAVETHAMYDDKKLN